ncbi:MAG: cytochrome c-type biogenesis protein CcmH [Thermoleophilia bacterium]|nr:cytochrome c-type biogenesis protein CcmH [Thermoleophilia bacterium]
MRRWLALGMALVAVGAPAASAFAVTAIEIQREVRCPTCNTPLDVSNSPAAQAIKDFIAVRVQRGESKEQILDSLVDEFGREVLATPPKSGFDLVVWIVPIVVLIGGLGAIPVVTRSWARRRRTDDPPTEISAEERERLEDELRRHPG